MPLYLYKKFMTTEFIIVLLIVLTALYYIIPMILGREKMRINVFLPSGRIYKTKWMATNETNLDLINVVTEKTIKNQPDSIVIDLNKRLIDIPFGLKGNCMFEFEFKKKLF